MKIKWKEKMKKQKGITLIALVITIIVLLILAGVSIAMITGENGILAKASQADKASEEAQIKEQIKLDITKWKTENIGKQIDNTTIQGIIDPKYGTLNGNNLMTKKGNIINVSDILSNAQGEDLQAKAKPGDYVKYNPGAKTFVMTKEQTGIEEGNQEFDTSTYKGLWQVLYNDEEHGLQIISADIVSELTIGREMYFSNYQEETIENGILQFDVYNNIINNLNRFCSNYVDDRYAINGRLVGSNPNSIFETEQQMCFYGIGEDAEIGDDNYLIDKNAMEQAKSQNEKEICNINKNYFLASREAYNDEESWGGYCGLRYIKNDGEISKETMISHTEVTYYISSK